MHNAPSVVYPVGRCVLYAGLLAMLGGLGVLVLLLWWWPWLGAPGDSPLVVRVAGVLGALLWLAWAGFAWRSWLRSPVGQLQWDALGAPDSGSARAGVWRWRRDAYADGLTLQRVERVLDLQSRLLLQLREPGTARHWVWVERTRDPARWNDLRRALVSVS